MTQSPGVPPPPPSSDQPKPVPRSWRRWFRRLRLLSVIVVVFGPIGLGAWHVHLTPHLRAGDEATAARAADYLDRRNPVVDRLLPSGSGGTRYYDSLGGDAGKAFIAAAAIALAVPHLTGGWPESTELHERAHLAHGFLPAEVNALLDTLPRPAAGEYAATNRLEHFAEMASKAWEIVAPPDGFCVSGTLVERLELAEAEVPGTAGFVARYLSVVTPTEGDIVALQAAALRLSEVQRDAWTRLWTAVDARRRPDGSFTPWGASSVREFIETHRDALLASGGWLDRIAAATLAPSLLVLAVAGR